MSKVDDTIAAHEKLIHEVFAEYLIRNQFVWMSPRNSLYIGPVDHQHYKYSRELPLHIFLQIAEKAIHDPRIADHAVTWVLKFGQDYMLNAFVTLCHHSRKHMTTSRFHEFRKVVKEWNIKNPGIIHTQLESKADVARRLRAELAADIDELAGQLTTQQAAMLCSIVERTRQYITEDNN